MSVAFARAVVAGCRHNGLRVHELPGCYSRGNGQTSAYEGALVHHTAGAFDGGMDLLVNGRSDLDGPLCNMAGHANGDLTLVAAHPANHAGASGGRSMGPLPVTGLFNRRAWGLEIMYPGSRPMTSAQFRSAQIMCGVVSGILKRPNPEWCRAHAETSITGKWDPGYAPGKTIDMGGFRGGIWGALHSSPSTSTTPDSKVEPVILHEKLVPGANYVRLPAMVGTASLLYGRAWVSVSGEGGGTMTVLFQKDAASDGPPPGAGKGWGPTTFRNASRVREPIPSGAEYIEAWVTVKGKGGFISIEFEPK
jgi:hypothetical protein